MLLILEKVIMHRPETAVRSGELGSLGCGFRLQVNLGQREVPEHKSELLVEVSLHGLDDRVSASAVRALVISVLHQRDRSVLIALDVIICCDWYFQRGHDCSPVSTVLPRLPEYRPHPGLRRLASNSSRKSFPLNQGRTKLVRTLLRFRGMRRISSQRPPWVRSRRAAGNASAGLSRTLHDTRRRPPKCP